jgi:hypothetical protein
MDRDNDDGAKRVLVTFVNGQPRSLASLGDIGEKWLDQLTVLVIKFGSSHASGRLDLETLGGFAGIFGCLADMFAINVASPLPGSDTIVLNDEDNRRMWLEYIADETGIPESARGELIHRLVEPAAYAECSKAIAWLMDAPVPV